MSPSSTTHSEPNPHTSHPTHELSWVDRVEQMATPRALLIAWILLFQVLALAYAPSFRSPFIYDDMANIVLNEDFRADNPIKAILSGHPTSMQFDRRPVSGVISWLNYELTGLNVTAFRAVNLLIHWLCAGVLWTVVWQIAHRSSGRAPRLFATILVGIWALHPIHSSAVIYISQRMESLMTLNFLLSCTCLLLATPRRPASPWWLFASVWGGFLSLLSKENAAGLPLVLLAIDRWFVTGSWRALWTMHKWYYFFIAVLWAIGLGWILTGPRVAEWNDIEALAHPWRYFQTECHVVFDYFRLLLWPSPLVFAPVPRIAETWSDWLPFFVALSIFFGLIAWRARTRPWLWIPWLTILAVLAPTSSFIPVPLEPAFDYRMHLPSAGAMAFLLVAGYSFLTRLSIGESWMLGITLAAMATLAGATRVRAEAFGRPESIWADVVRKEPENIKAWYNLSAYLIGEKRLQEARFAAEAGHTTNRVFQLPWIDAQYHQLLGLMAQTSGNWEDALSEFEKADTAVPGRTEFTLGRARALIHLERPAEAMVLLDALASNEQGGIEAQLWRALALVRLGRIDEATPVAEGVEKARALTPDLEASRHTLRSELSRLRAARQATGSRSQ